MTPKGRMRRAITLAGPDYPPAEGGFSPATWQNYREALVPLAKRLGVGVPADFEFKNLPGKCKKGVSYTDNYGCQWECIVDGMEGIIKEYPFQDWQALTTYQFPDPLRKRESADFDLASFTQRAAGAREHFMWAGGYDNRLWERLHFLRGYENTLCDLASGDSRIIRLLDLIVEHNLQYLEAVTRTQVDGVFFGDDWGDQQRLMISPSLWREVFKPRYTRLFQICRSRGKHVFFHSDGYLLPIIPDLIECGASVLNLQFRPNGLAAIAALCRGKVCVAIDLDRQQVLPYGTPADVKEHVRECVTSLNCSGGVIVWFDIYPDVPLQNIAALAEAVEELRENTFSGSSERQKS